MLTIPPTKKLIFMTWDIPIGKSVRPARARRPHGPISSSPLLSSFGLAFGAKKSKLMLKVHTRSYCAWARIERIETGKNFMGNSLRGIFFDVVAALDWLRSKPSTFKCCGGGCTWDLMKPLSGQSITQLQAATPPYKKEGSERWDATKLIHHFAMKFFAVSILSIFAQAQ